MQRYSYTSMTHLAADFADFVASTLSNSLAQQQQASLVVPGGHTPCHYLPALGRLPLPWSKITITLSDERWVDLHDQASNERLARENLLAHMAEKANFIGLKTHHASPDKAIEVVHKRLKRIPLPFSLVILGLGEDGHIASLFPGMNPDSETSCLCLAVAEPVAPSPRISLSLTALTNSHYIALVVNGAQKRHLLDQLSKYPDPNIPFVWLLQRTNSPIIIFETDEDLSQA